MSAGLPRLNRLGLTARLALSVLILTMLGGYFVAGVHLKWHYENRDGLAGMSRDDITAAYHGIEQESPMRRVLAEGHPETLSKDERDALIAWLDSGDLLRDYDLIERGDMAPVEIIDRSCLSCHSRASTQGDGIGRRVPLEFLDDVSRIAVSRQVLPNSKEIVAASMHAHAPSMSLVMLVLTLLALCVPCPRGVVGVVAMIGALGLAGDFAGQWFARDAAGLSWAIVIGGFAAAGATTLLGLIAAVGMWLPSRAD